MLSITPAFFDGRLEIVGHDANDTVLIGTVDVEGVPHVTVNGVSVGSGVPAAAVTSIVADLGAGSDTINLSTLDLATFSGLSDGSITLTGGAGNDKLTGTSLADVLIGEGGNDYLTGLRGNDLLLGGDANDTLIGGEGDDEMHGGTGIDRYIFAGTAPLGSDLIVEPTGDHPDKLDFKSLGGAATIDLGLTTPQTVRPGQLTITLSDASAVEDIVGTPYADVFFGNSRANRIDGFTGDDVIRGREGNDILLGGAGDDFIDGEGGNDTLNGNQGDDSLYGGDGNDNLTGFTGTDYLAGGDGADTYTFTTAGAGGLDTIDETPGSGEDRFNVSGLSLTAFPDFESTAVQAITSLQSIQFVTAASVEWFLGGSVNVQPNADAFEDGFYAVPGPIGTTTLVEFTYGGAIAGYDNDIFVFDATDPINRYAARPISEYLFTGNVTPLGATKSLPFQAGSKLGFFIEQDGSANDLFFSEDGRNDHDTFADSNRNHAQAFATAPGIVQLRWEDLYYERPNPRGYKIDHDYNDLFVGIAAKTVELPVVSIQAIDDVAHEAYRDTGTYVITRESGNLDDIIPVQIIVSGDAGYGFHYELSPDLPPLRVGGDGHQSTITLLPGVERLYVTLTPLVEDIDNTVRKATIELPVPEIPLYSIAEGYESATVTIIPADQRGDLIISGRITYEGPTGIENGYALTFGSLPVRAAKVEIWDRNGGVFGFGDELVGTTYTDDNGRYEILISSSDTVTFGGFVEPYVVVVAQSAPEDVVTIAHEVATPGTTKPARMRFVESEDVTSHGPGSLTLDGALTDHGHPDENGAFSVFDAIYSSSRYHVTLPGVTPATVKAELARTGRNEFTRDGRIRILTTSRFGWDTIGHEYGHFAHVHAGVTLPEVQDHYFERNMRFPNPVQGWQIAFTEGFATYFSLVAQALTPKPPTGIAGFGDTEYWGISSINGGLQLGSRTDIEAGGPTLVVTPGYERELSVSLGDDNEVSVFRVLWDLYDPANDDPIGDIGDVGVWVLMVGVGAEARELPDFYSGYLNLTAGATTERVWEIGQVLAAHNIVPSPLRVDYGADATPLDMLFNPPTFVVSAIYGSTHGLDQDQWLFDTVQIRFYSDSGEWIDVSGSTVISIPETQSSEISWTPTSDQWAELIGGGVSRWSVVATTRSAGGGLISQYESFAGTVAFG